MAVPGLIQTLIHSLLPWFCWIQSHLPELLAGDPPGSLGFGGSRTFPALSHHTMPQILYT